MNRRRFVPKHLQEQRRALRDAVRRGDVATGKELTKRLLGLQQQLFGAAGEPTDNGRPFNDDLPF